MSHHKKTTSEIQLSVIVLFYHGENWIKPCIESLENQSLPRNKYEIILVDNGGSTPSIRKHEGQDNIKTLYFNKNQGFAGGNNMAFAHANGEFIVLMNQDVVVHFNCLDAMVSAFERNPDAGVISANMIMVIAGDKIDYQSDPSGTVGLYRLSALGYASYYTKRTNQAMIPVEFVSGNGLCFRSCVLKDVGNYLFDARLGSYAEDLDLSIRLKKTVWQMYVHPRAAVYHFRDEAFSGNPIFILRKFFHVSSNRLLVYFNNLPISKFSVKFPALVLGIPFKVIRPDGSLNFGLFNFLIALGCVPFILVLFSLRALRFSVFGKNLITTKTPPADNK